MSLPPNSQERSASPVALGEAASVYRRLHMYHDGKIGFVIYRTDYSDDKRWALFMHRMTRYVEWRLEHDGDDLVENPGASLKAVFGWDVRDDQVAFEDASISDIRKYDVFLGSHGVLSPLIKRHRHFNHWAASVSHLRNETRYNCCILADEQVVDSVLDGESPGAGEDCRAYVKVISGEYEKEKDILVTDREQHEALEGCTAYYVGWTKRFAATLFPRGYSLLSDHAFHMWYERPPAVVDD